MSDNNEKGLMEPIRDGDDFRIKRAHSPEANAKRAATMRRKAQKKREAEKFKDFLIEGLNASGLAGMSDEEIIKTYSYGLDPDDPFTKKELLSIKLIDLATHETDPVKYIKLYETIRDTIGEKPVDKQETKVETSAPVFATVFEKLDNISKKIEDEENKED